MARARWAAVLLLSGVLAAAGALKILDPHPFAGELIRSLDLGVSDWTWTTQTVTVIGAWEVLLGVALVVPWTNRHVLPGVAALMIGFAAWDVCRWAVGGSASCGCFGQWDGITEWWQIGVKHLLLAAAFVAAAVATLTRASHSPANAAAST